MLARETSTDWSLKRRSDDVDEEFGEFEEDKELDEDFDDEPKTITTISTTSSTRGMRTTSGPRRDRRGSGNRGRDWGLGWLEFSSP